MEVNEVVKRQKLRIQELEKQLNQTLSTLTSMAEATHPLPKSRYKQSETVLYLSYLFST